MEQVFLPAAASTPAPEYGVAEAPPVGLEAGRRVTLPDLPIWARSDEAKALLERVIAERPERTKPLTQTMTGGIASFGYRGKAANALRTLFRAFEYDRLDWIAEHPFNSPDWHRRRNAFIAYAKANDADALIERALKAAA